MQTLQSLLLQRSTDVDAMLSHLDGLAYEGPPEVRLFLAALDEVIPLRDPETSATLVRAVATWVVKVSS